ncbi:hypothetical protein BSZ36_06945 [Rubricoccus marinus]|uniref:Bacterial surface antigen (D15) domain-containing protein n=1 Tax=Rubricoccus marinus TaxID=716817 RepID=A0A259TYA3_9BACT|nr:hypothetical protein BSZ36_06945 [Rubricoccus marinus]
MLARQGYAFARVDSITPEAIHVTPGPRVLVRSLALIADSISTDGLQTGWATREGAPLAPEALAADLERLAEALRWRGYADARIEPLAGVAGTPPGYEVTIRVREGRREPIGRVAITGGSRVTDRFAARASGVRLGAPLDGITPEAVRRSVRASGAFAAVGQPTLARDADGTLVLQIPVESGPPGRADVVLGYLPPAAGQSGQVVGSGRVELLGPFGGGRALSLSLDRNPGLASRFSASARDPFVFGLPLAAAVAFEGESRDSTYNRQRLRGEVGARLGASVRAALTLAGESVQPGRAGARIGLDGLPRVRRSSAGFVGVALRYDDTDAPLAPRRGLQIATLVEQGVRTRGAAPEAPTPTRFSQQRLDVSARGYLPLAGRLVGAAGADAQLILNARGLDSGGGLIGADEGELIRYGGATSLRGYDEDALLGDAVGRLLAEARFLLGGDAFAFAFGDLGVVRRPPLAGEPGETRVLPGYGLGAQLDTGLGLVRLTYALNPDLPAARGKVHIGLGVGL